MTKPKTVSNESDTAEIVVQDQEGKTEIQHVQMPPAEIKSISTETQQQRQTLALRKNGSMELATLGDQFAYAQRLISEKMISTTFQTPQQVVLGIQYAKAMDMEPILALRKMYVVNGVPTLYSEGPLALVQRSSKFTKINEYFLDEKGEKICPANKNLKEGAWAAVTEVWRAGDTEPQIDYFTKDDIAQSGVDKSYKGKKDVWEKWERDMMRYKARARALRSKFADLLMGVAILEHDFNQTIEMVTEVDANKVDFAAEINKTLAK